MLELLAYAQINTVDIEAVIISSVVPTLTKAINCACRRYLNIKPTIVKAEKCKMPILIENPSEAGADLVAGAIGGFRIYGGPCLVIDMGTATTFCAVSAKGEFLGGAITTGIGISIEALHHKTAMLPRVALAKPLSVIGKTTTTSMQAGIFFGLLGQIEGIIKRFKAELGEDLKVIATGGFAELVFSESEDINYVEPDLILKGLYYLHQLGED